MNNLWLNIFPQISQNFLIFYLYHKLLTFLDLAKFYRKLNYHLKKHLMTNQKFFQMEGPKNNDG